ncbi:hypothetical protein [Mesotoga sp. UBA6090]|uniref:hypothetical protein n=1 Tax=Mesotoga sp. UBA6090 TaxID=1946860 RepID=UPI0026008B12|nr:hypothetical protein [Mesotoga sp. UBA6090]
MSEVRCAVCPVDDKGTLTTRTFFSRKSDTRRKEIPARIFILVAALAFLLPITVSIFAGAFETEKARVYVVPEDIKGSTSLSEISSVVEDFHAFLEHFGIPKDEPKTSQLKDLKTKHSIEISDIKEYLSEE